MFHFKHGVASFGTLNFIPTRRARTPAQSLLAVSLNVLLMRRRAAFCAMWRSPNERTASEAHKLCCAKMTRP